MFAVFALVVVCFLFVFDSFSTRREKLRLARSLAITLGLLTPANLADVPYRRYRNRFMDSEGEPFWLLIVVPFILLTLLSAVFVVWGINRGIREDERDGSSE